MVLLKNHTTTLALISTFQTVQYSCAMDFYFDKPASTTHTKDFLLITPSPEHQAQHKANTVLQPSKHLFGEYTMFQLHFRGITLLPDSSLRSKIPQLRRIKKGGGKKKVKENLQPPLSLTSCHWLFPNKLVCFLKLQLRNLCFLGIETETTKRKMIFGL